MITLCYHSMSFRSMLFRRQPLKKIDSSESMICNRNQIVLGDLKISETRTKFYKKHAKYSSEWMEIDEMKVEEYLPIFHPFKIACILSVLDGMDYSPFKIEDLTVPSKKISSEIIKKKCVTIKMKKGDTRSGAEMELTIDNSIENVYHLDKFDKFQYQSSKKMNDAIESGIKFLIGCNCEDSSKCYCNLNYEYYYSEPMENLIIIVFQCGKFYDFDFSIFAKWQKYFMNFTQLHEINQINFKKIFNVANRLFKNSSLFGNFIKINDPLIRRIASYNFCGNYGKTNIKKMITRFIEECNRYYSVGSLESSAGAAGAGSAGAGADLTNIKWIELKIFQKVSYLLSCFSEYMRHIKTEICKINPDTFDIAIIVGKIVKHAKSFNSENFERNLIRCNLKKLVIGINNLSKFASIDKVDFTNFVFDELPYFKRNEISTSECSLCSDLKVTCTIPCCRTNICVDCLVSCIEPSRKGFVRLFPQCPFCRTNLPDCILELNDEIKKEYTILQKTVVDTSIDDAIKLWNEGKHYFCRCNECRFLFTIEKTCASEDDMPTVCKKCSDISSFVERECPNCHYSIQRIDGCNNIKCICNKSMCWLCGIQIEDHDVAHFTYGFFGSRCINTG